MVFASFPVLKSQNNVGAMKQLVTFASQQLEENRYLHIGSSCLWNHHVQSVNKMAARLHRFKVKEVLAAYLVQIYRAGTQQNL